MKGKRNAAFQEARAAAARSSEGMKTLFDICEGLQESMQPIADLQRQIRAARAPRLEVGRPELAVGRIIEHQGQFARAVARLQLGSLASAARELVRHAHRAQALDEAGWLPHHSMPFDWVEECPGDANAIHRLLSRRFRERRSDAYSSPHFTIK